MTKVGIKVTYSGPPNTEIDKNVEKIMDKEIPKMSGRWGVKMAHVYCECDGWKPEEMPGEAEFCPWCGKYLIDAEEPPLTKKEIGFLRKYVFEEKR